MNGWDRRVDMTMWRFWGRFQGRVKERSTSAIRLLHPGKNLRVTANLDQLTNYGQFFLIFFFFFLKSIDKS